MNKKGFTLIELLVVITIIGILATGATSVYTSQIQKARDATRITSLNALKSWVEQFYQDDGVYPTPLNFNGVTIYTPKLPKDPKSWQASGKSSFEYAYVVWPDTNTILQQDYELSTTFENAWNLNSKANDDWWANPNRYEIGIDLTWNNTRINWVQNVISWISDWIPSWNVCVAVNGTNEALTWDNLTAKGCDVNDILVIK